MSQKRRKNKKSSDVESPAESGAAGEKGASDVESPEESGAAGGKGASDHSSQDKFIDVVQQLLEHQHRELQAERAR